MNTNTSLFVGLFLVVSSVPLGGADTSASGITVGHPAQEPALAARTAIVQAEAAVARAEALRALWTNAQEALDRAREAYSQGNFAAAQDAARDAREFAELGIAQLKYPLTR
ncbi:MAG: hypothetical protein WDZ63_03910 [Burkholderiales bacterium]